MDAWVSSGYRCIGLRGGKAGVWCCGEDIDFLRQDCRCNGGGEVVLERALIAADPGRSATCACNEFPFSRRSHGIVDSGGDGSCSRGARGVTSQVGVYDVGGRSRERTEIDAGNVLIAGTTALDSNFGSSCSAWGTG